MKQIIIFLIISWILIWACNAFAMTWQEVFPYVDKTCVIYLESNVGKQIIIGRIIKLIEKSEEFYAVIDVRVGANEEIAVKYIVNINEYDPWEEWERWQHPDPRPDIDTR